MSSKQSSKDQAKPAKDQAQADANADAAGKKQVCDKAREERRGEERMRE